MKWPHDTKSAILDGKIPTGISKQRNVKLDEVRSFGSSGYLCSFAIQYDGFITM